MSTTINYKVLSAEYNDELKPSRRLNKNSLTSICLGQELKFYPAFCGTFSDLEIFFVVIVFFFFFVFFRLCRLVQNFHSLVRRQLIKTLICIH